MQSANPASVAPCTHINSAARYGLLMRSADVPQRGAPRSCRRPSCSRPAQPCARPCDRAAAPAGASRCRPGRRDDANAPTSSQKLGARASPARSRRAARRLERRGQRRRIVGAAVGASRTHAGRCAARRSRGSSRTGSQCREHRGGGSESALVHQLRHQRHQHDAAQRHAVCEMLMARARRVTNQRVRRAPVGTLPVSAKPSASSV